MNQEKQKELNDQIYLIIKLIADKIKTVHWGIYKTTDETSLKPYQHDSRATE